MKDGCGNCELYAECLIRLEAEHNICEYYEPKNAKEIRKPKKNEEKK
jgi:hypothetical protein